MGLDALEFIMALEDRFDIEIPDDAAELLEGPREVTDYVFGRLNGDTAEMCLSQVAFHRLRRVLVDVCGVPRSSVRPGSPLENIVARKSRRSEWRQIRSTSRMPLPDLVRPKWTLASGGVVVLLAAAFGYRLLGAPLALTMGLIAMTLCFLLTRPFKICFGSRHQTVGALVGHVAALHPEYVVALRPERFGAESSSWTREKVRETVHELVEKIFEVADFDDDAKFYRDIPVN